jgi:ABC-2 type transport system ATP-binding protein
MTSVLKWSAAPYLACSDPNGAGKTSTIRIITTITGPDSGKVYFDNEILSNSHPPRMGYLPEERGLYKKMKVGDHLVYLAQLKGLTAHDATVRCKAMLNRFEALDWWNKKIEELSKGYATESSVHRYDCA